MSTRGHNILIVAGAALISGAGAPCLGASGHDGQKIAQFYAAGSQDPGCIRLVEQAQSLFARRQYGQAIGVLKQACQLNPQSAQAHFYLASAYFHQQDIEPAIQEYKTVLALSPHTAEAMFNLGSCYEHERRHETAISWFEQYLQEKPDAADASNVGRMITEIKNKMAVRGLFQQSRELLEQQHPLDARFLLERAVAIEPDSPEIHYNLGMAYHNSGNLPMAIVEFEHALKLKPGMSGAMLNIGSSYQALGQKQEAIGWFQKYLSASPQAADHKVISDMIDSLQKETNRPGVFDDPHGPDFFASISRQGLVRRWPEEKIPIKVYIDRGLGVGGMRDSFLQILVDSLDAWMKAAQGKLAYRLVARLDDGDLACDWTSNPADVTEQGTENEQGVAHVIGKNIGGGVVEISRATVRLLTIDREQGEPRPVTDDVMKKTCLHEIGHALGLIGHSPNSHDVMFYSESPTVWPVLSRRDKATLLKLYQAYPPVVTEMPVGAPASSRY